MPIEETFPAPVEAAPSTPDVPVQEESAKPVTQDVPASLGESASVDELNEAALTIALRVRDGLKSGATQGVITVKKGFASARAKRDAEERAWDARSARTDLPAISKEAPLLDLATRLHRQAGFFRELAVDALRPTLSLHILHALVVMLALFGGLLGLALVSQVLTGNESALFIPTSVIAAASALCAAALSGLLERSRRVTSREAFTQALRAEEALEKIALLLADNTR